jgi:hypothetical protein
MTQERRVSPIVAIDDRVRALEQRAIRSDDLHTSLLHADSQTAASVDQLTKAINDPYTGLIVQLNTFRTEVINDRKEFRAWIRGATFVLSVVFGIVTIAAPWIQKAVELVFNSKP